MGIKYTTVDAFKDLESNCRSYALSGSLPDLKDGA